MKILLSLAAATLTTSALFGATVADARTSTEQTQPEQTQRGQAQRGQAQPEQSFRTRADLTRAGAEARAVAAFGRLDANQDGVLSAADRQADASRRFAALDTDGDGALSPEEFSAARQGAGGAMGGAARRGINRPAGGMGQWGGRLPDDARISQADFIARALARFDALDANGDGAITAADRGAGKDEPRAPRRPRG